VRKNTREEGQSATLSPAVQDVMKQHCAPDVRLHEHLRQLGGYFNEPLLDAVTRQLG